MQRLGLFFIIAFITMGWAMLQQSPGLIKTCFLVLVIIGIIGEFFYVSFAKHRRSVIVTKFLEAGDVDRFLAEIEKDIEKEKSKVYKDMLLVNKTAGLYYMGRSREAVRILDEIKIVKLPKLFRYLYYNNRMANLILDERINEAQELVDKNPEVFKMTDKPSLINHAMQGNLAALAFHQGDHEKSRVMLEGLLRVKRSRFYAAATHLYLGSIELKKGNTDEAKAHLTEASQAAPATYIAERAQRLLTMV